MVEEGHGGRKASLSCGTGYGKYNCLFQMRVEKVLEIF